jgi:outer membrane protein OmpA-like peptidoglycan-associated protein
MRFALIGLILAAWLLLGWVYKVDHDRCCGQDIKDKSAILMFQPALVFDFDSARPSFKNRWKHVKDSLLSLIDENHKLEITGFQCSEESDSIGFSRARTIRETFLKVPDDRFIIMSRKVVCNDKHRSLPFEGVDMNIRYVTKSVIEEDGKAIVYFPLNSTEKLNGSDVESYLDKYIERHKQGTSVIQVIGYTDDQGGQQKNQTLGYQRAKVIRDYLVSKNFPESRIKLISLGEANPIGSNATEEGRAQNRRTELIIQKAQ